MDSKDSMDSSRKSCTSSCTYRVVLGIHCFAHVAPMDSMDKPIKTRRCARSSTRQGRRLGREQEHGQEQERQQEQEHGKGSGKGQSTSRRAAAPPRMNLLLKVIRPSRAFKAFPLTIRSLYKGHGPPGFSHTLGGAFSGSATMASLLGKSP